MTMEANTRATAKIGEPKPSIRPTDQAVAATNAEWALGMPPVLRK